VSGFLWALAVLVLLGVLILVHELGHFIFARLFDVKVLRFSLGFGPRVFGFTHRETEYRLSLVPLGGYVRLLGEDPGEPIPPIDRPRALAAMRRYDVLIVNPIIDGMNLVAKEGPAVNERHGVLVLSRTAGAFEQLAEVALPITPTDIDETATELYEALRMSSRERAQRAERARAIVEAETPVDWALAQLRDAVELRRASTRSHPQRAERVQAAPVA